MASTIKRPLQHETGQFRTTCSVGNNIVSTTNTTGDIPNSRQNLILCVTNHSADATTTDFVYVDGSDIRINAQKAQAITVTWHRFVGGHKTIPLSIQTGVAA